MSKRSVSAPKTQVPKATLRLQPEVMGVEWLLAESPASSNRNQFIPRSIDWSITAVERQAKTPQLPKMVDHHEAAWKHRWSSPETLDAVSDFSEIPRVTTATVKQRRADLLANKFRQLSNPKNASGESIVLEKIHKKVLRERHFLSILGTHERALDILDSVGLGRLTREIESASKKALAENKRQKDYSRRVPGKIRWHAENEEEWFGVKLKANKQLAALMQKHWDIISAVRVVDYLSPAGPAFSFGLLRGASSDERDSYLRFLVAVTDADAAVEKKPGKPGGPHAGTLMWHRRAESEYRRLFKIDFYASHAKRCGELENLMHAQGLSIAGKTLQKSMGPLFRKLKKKSSLKTRR